MEDKAGISDRLTREFNKEVKEHQSVTPKARGSGRGRACRRKKRWQSASGPGRR